MDKASVLQQGNASAGNRTQVTSMATMYSAARPLMLRTRVRSGLASHALRIAAAVSGVKATPRGFEPLRAEPNGFRAHLLNRSDTVSLRLARFAWYRRRAAALPCGCHAVTCLVAPGRRVCLLCNSSVRSSNVSARGLLRSARAEAATLCVAAAPSPRRLSTEFQARHFGRVV